MSDMMPQVGSGIPPLLDSLREVKVKLPADQVLRLHYARLKNGQSFSTTVSNALMRYFDELSRP